MRALDSAATMVLWGPTRTLRNREVMWAVLVTGHCMARWWQAQ